MARKQTPKAPTKAPLKVVPLPAKKKIGEEHVPTNEGRTLVSVCSACGYTLEQIAPMLHISVNTLRKHYQHELTTGRDQMIAKVAGNLFATAMQRADLKASNTASIFILKTRGGWREGEKAEEGATGGTVVDVFLKIGDKEPKVA